MSPAPQESGMNKERAFLDIPRQEPGYRPAEERIRDYRAVELLLDEQEVVRQAARCMDCGTPFCHGYGCTLNNVIPELNTHVYYQRWRQAFELLEQKNPFPEFTGRICPALCEGSCVVGLHGEAVTIRQIELFVAEKAFELGIAGPRPPAARVGRKIAIIGAGPAGLAVAHTLNRAGFDTMVFDNAHHPGGLMRYGIPDFKMEKRIIQRRVDLMHAEGVRFEGGVEVGRDISTRYLWDRFDAIVLAGGARAPRDLAVPGRSLQGVHLALDYLVGQNLINAGEKNDQPAITAAGKNVVVVGGGDTGADCVGTAIRQGAKSVTQVEILPQPPRARADGNPWPQWPMTYRESSSHKEGCSRKWNITTHEFIGSDGRVTALKCAEVEWKNAGGRLTPVEKPGTGFTLEADLVLLAMGFTGPVKGGMLEQFGITFDNRGLPVRDASGMTQQVGVFAAGDMATGATLVVKAMADGIRVAKGVMSWLTQSK